MSSGVLLKIEEVEKEIARTQKNKESLRRYVRSLLTTDGGRRVVCDMKPRTRKDLGSRAGV